MSIQDYCDIIIQDFKNEGMIKTAEDKTPVVESKIVTFLKNVPNMIESFEKEASKVTIQDILNYKEKVS